MSETAAVALLDAAGTVILDLAEEDGFTLLGFSRPGRDRRRALVTSPFADGDFETQSVIAAGEAIVAVLIKAPTYPQVMGRLEAVTAAAEQVDWLLRHVLAGVVTTWRARAASIDSPDDDVLAQLPGTSDLDQPARHVTLRVPCQPHPTVTGAV